MSPRKLGYVREHIPLEQGLRLVIRQCNIKELPGQRAYSIRTRIKTTFLMECHLRGIKVREHIPLEQGLRHEELPLIDILHFSQRAYSIRTRIKTHLIYSLSAKE